MTTATLEPATYTMTPMQIRAAIEAATKSADAAEIWRQDRQAQNDFVCEVQAGRMTIEDVLALLEEWANTDGE